MESKWRYNCAFFGIGDIGTPSFGLAAKMADPFPDYWYLTNHVDPLGRAAIFDAHAYVSSESLYWFEANVPVTGHFPYGYDVEEDA